MEQVNMIGIDLAKNSFQLHGARADGSVAFRKKLSRAKLLDFVTAQPRCTVAMEACGGAHHWGREIGRLGQGRQCPLLSDRAAPPIDIRDQHTERALPEEGTNEMGLAKSRLLPCHARHLWPAEAIVHGFPQSQSFGTVCVVGLERHNVRRPTRRHGNPVAFREEEGLGQNAAPNLEVATIAWVRVSVSRATLMLQAAVFGWLVFWFFSTFNDCGVSPEVGICGGDVADALMVAVVSRPPGLARRPRQ